LRSLRYNNNELSMTIDIPKFKPFYITLFQLSSFFKKALEIYKPLMDD